MEKYNGTVINFNSNHCYNCKFLDKFKQIMIIIGKLYKLTI
jgi:hypothetical protein